MLNRRETSDKLFVQQYITRVKKFYQLDTRSLSGGLNVRLAVNS